MPHVMGKSVRDTYGAGGIILKGFGITCGSCQLAFQVVAQDIGIVYGSSIYDVKEIKRRLTCPYCKSEQIVEAPGHIHDTRPMGDD